MTFDPITIRSAAEADIGALVALNEEVQRLHVAIEPSLFRPIKDDGERDAFFRGTLAAPEHFSALAKSTRRSIGYVWFERQTRASTPFTFERTRLYVHHLSVDPSARAQGVGTALMAQVETEARRLGCLQIALDTWFENEAARSFFSKRGYRQLNVISVKSLA